VTPLVVLAWVAAIGAQEPDAEPVTPPNPPELVVLVTQDPVRPKAKYWTEVPFVRSSGGRISQVQECTFTLAIDTRGKVSDVTSHGCPPGFEKSGLKAAKHWRFEPWPSRDAAEATSYELTLRWNRHP